VSTAQISAVENWGDWAVDGFLFTYGPNTNDAMHRIAVYVDKVLAFSFTADILASRTGNLGGSACRPMARAPSRIWMPRVSRVKVDILDEM